MQKISSYLYPNRINVVADVSLFPVRWNIVYQNRVKIYKGVDNVLTLDVKNADQKRIDISEMTLKISLTDINGQVVLVKDVTPSSTLGLATFLISAGDISLLTPQFLNFSIYRENEDDTTTIFYADTQFGAIGKIELLDSAIGGIPVPERYITVFNPITDTDKQPYETTYYSEAVELRKPNYLEAPENESVELEFKFNKSKAVVTVQFATETIVGNSTVWTDVMSFGVFPEDVSTTKTIEYPTYNRNVSWMRVKFNQLSYNGEGATVNISKRTVGLDTEALFTPGKTGKGYKVGETFTISADRFGGGGAWELTVAAVDGNGGVTAWNPITEPVVAEGGDVAYLDVPVSTPAKARSIDKVIVRL